MVKGKIGCFFTGGFTEAGAMQSFFEKINPSYTFHQLFPNKPRRGRKNNERRTLCAVDGCTGNELIDKAVKIITEYNESFSIYDALIFEDDADSRFRNKTDVEIVNYCEALKSRIQQAWGCKKPVYIFFASPEIESWFIANWNNGFGWLYRDSGQLRDLSSDVRTYFCHRFLDYINRNILSQCNCDIELFFNSSTTYRKLSDLIAEYFSLLPNIPSSTTEGFLIRESKYVRYYKNSYGSLMLRNIDPAYLSSKCKHFFAPTYFSLQGLGFDT